jgi:hypothetical protein
MNKLPAILLSLIFAGSILAADDGVLTPYTSEAGKFTAVFLLGTEKDNVTRRKLEFSTVDSRDASGNPLKTYAVSSFVYSETDYDYTEKMSYADYANPVTAAQLEQSLNDAMQAFRHRDNDGRITDPAKLRVFNRHSIISNGKSGLACTANDSYSSNEYYENVAVGKRLYQLTVLTDATEEPDDPNHRHKIESERFFNSFKIVQ